MSFQVFCLPPKTNWVVFVVEFLRSSGYESFGILLFYIILFEYFITFT